MKRISQAVLLLLLGSMALAKSTPFQRQLSQLKAKARGNDEEPEPIPDDGGDTPDDGDDLELCTCELSGIVGGGFAAAGQGNHGASAAAFVETTAEEAESTPDTIWHSQCESECCACNVGQHSATASATRTKRFVINGAIDIEE
jgi:hypothetical protein